MPLQTVDFEEVAVYVRSTYLSHYRLVLEGGKLVDKWANVARHCFIQCVATEVLADLLGLDGGAKARLASVAACHDWAKRVKGMPEDFSDEERQQGNALLEAARPDAVLMAALNPWFLPLALAGEATFLQLIQFFIDDMTRDDEIVTFDERVAEAEARNPDPDPVVREKLGRPYWDAEREVGHTVEMMVLAILNARRVAIRTPSELVAHINVVLQHRFQPDTEVSQA